ncbi:43964_t:CDS:2, partial [Gigaspora margarita]
LKKMDDLSTYTSSKKSLSESSDTYEHESDRMVISSPEQQKTNKPDEIARQSSDTAASAYTKKLGKRGRSLLYSDA